VKDGTGRARRVLAKGDAAAGRLTSRRPFLAYLARMTSSFRYGRSASGTTTLPSFCW